MKIYISADIEGVTGVSHWDETDIGKPGYDEAREQMTAEVVAACEGALEAGATEIWVKDAHDTARNIIAARLPREARLVRAWSGHPFAMLQELDSSFAALALIGYHAAAASGGSPLAHTMNGNITWLKINGAYASEFLIAAYTAGLVQVPLVLLSGDHNLCDEASRFNPGITTIPVKTGVGGSTINIHPALACERIRAGMIHAIQEKEKGRIAQPDHFSVEIDYRRQGSAYDKGFYPGARQTGPTTVCFEHSDYFEVLRFLLFCL